MRLPALKQWVSRPFTKTHTKILGASLVMSIGFFSTSCGEGSKLNLEIPGVKGPTVTLLEDNVLISMVFEELVLDGGLRYKIPKYPNSYLEISPDFQSGGTLMAVSVSLQDVFNGEAKFLDPQKLPGGRALPGVINGQLPAVAFSIEKFKNMAFYLGPEVFGVFIPLKNLNLQGSIITARFYTGETRIGNLSLVGEDDNGENSGFLLMLDMKGSTKSRLESVAKKYQ